MAMQRMICFGFVILACSLSGSVEAEPSSMIHKANGAALAIAPAVAPVSRQRASARVDPVQEVDSSAKDRPAESEYERCVSGWWNRLLDDPIATFTALLFFVTLLLWWATRELVKDAKTTSERQASEIKQIERAFVHLDGFNYELTTAVDSKTPLESLPLAYQTYPRLYITRFAIQPKWRNSGNTPVKAMTVRMNWRLEYLEGTSNPNYEYDGEPKAIFLAPHACEPGDFVEIPNAHDCVDYGLGLGTTEQIILIWGRADYKDVFDKEHFMEWCYRLRFDDHKGEGLRASFYQWGTYNRSD